MSGANASATIAMPAIGVSGILPAATRLPPVYSPNAIPKLNAAIFSEEVKSTAFGICVEAMLSMPVCSDGDSEKARKPHINNTGVIDHF